jgi:hypothetical protein
MSVNPELETEKRLDTVFMIKFGFNQESPTTKAQLLGYRCFTISCYMY